MIIIEKSTNTVLGEVPDRPLANRAIIRYKGINYNRVMGSTLLPKVFVEKRGGAFGQVATPDYNLDIPIEIKPNHLFRVCYNMSEGCIGEVTLNSMPTLGGIVTIDSKDYRIVDYSIGQRLVDELYVMEVHDA